MSNAFKDAYHLARTNFMNKPPHQMSALSGCTYCCETASFYVEYAGIAYNASYPDGEVFLAAPDGAKPSSDTAVILLHYLSYSNGTPLQHKWISFRELPGGGIYYVPFQNRTLRPLITAFSADPSRLLGSGRALGGDALPIGGARCVAVRVPVLPRVPVGFVLWPGDGEMPASGNILYDASVEGYLPTEDVVVCTSHVVHRLKEVCSGYK